MDMLTWPHEDEAACGKEGRNRLFVITASSGLVYCCRCHVLCVRQVLHLRTKPSSIPLQGAGLWQLAVIVASVVVLVVPGCAITAVFHDQG